MKLIAAVCFLNFASNVVLAMFAQTEEKRVYGSFKASVLNINQHTELPRESAKWAVTTHQYGDNQVVKEEFILLKSIEQPVFSWGLQKLNQTTGTYGNVYSTVVSFKPPCTRNIVNNTQTHLTITEDCVFLAGSSIQTILDARIYLMDTANDVFGSYKKSYKIESLGQKILEYEFNISVEPLSAENAGSLNSNNKV